VQLSGFELLTSALQSRAAPFHLATSRASSLAALRVVLTMSSSLERAVF
jgi:hypothetical protein